MRRGFVCRNFIMGLAVTLVFILSSAGWASTTVTLEQPVYFVSASGDPVHLEPGTYDLELAESWLRVGTGQPEDALLLQASILEHDLTLEEPSALSVPGEEPDQHHLVLLLPDGKQVEAIGSYSGVIERGGKRKFTRGQALQQWMKMHKARQAARTPKPAPRPPSIVPSSPSVSRPQTPPINLPDPNTFPRPSASSGASDTQTLHLIQGCVERLYEGMDRSGRRHAGVKILGHDQHILFGQVQLHVRQKDASMIWLSQSEFERWHSLMDKLNRAIQMRILVRFNYYASRQTDTLPDGDVYKVTLFPHNMPC